MASRTGALLAAALLLAGVGPAQGQDVPVPEPRPEAGAADAVQPDSTAGKPAVDLPYIHRAACAAVISGRASGEFAGPVGDGECGATSPWRLQTVAGVALSGEPLASCAMAEGLAELGVAAKAAATELLGTELETIITGPGYECRRRNRAESGKLSEHAFANALDIAGFGLSDGRRITVAADWPHLPDTAGDRDEADEDTAAGESATGREGAEPAPPAGERAGTAEAKFLVTVRDAACGLFSTVLSPDSNAAHRAHLHFDLGCHGRDCTYLICE